MPDQTITSVSRESRKFRPSAEFKAQANLGSDSAYKRLYAESVNSPEKFWERQAKEHLVWRKTFRKVLDWQPPHAKWFVGGKLNVCENCIDRHLGTHRENKAALIFEGEPGDVRTITYRQLHFHVCRWANAFHNMGIGEGDRVAIYMPMIPEAVIAMLACARVGAVHTVVFGGFSPEALKDRINDCKAKLVITADGGYRRGAVVPLKKNVDDALVIRDAASGRVVYETQAAHDGRWGGSEPLWGAMLNAALQGFPQAPEGPRQVNIEVPR